MPRPHQLHGIQDFSFVLNILFFIAAFLRLSYCCKTSVDFDVLILTVIAYIAPAMLSEPRSSFTGVCPCVCVSRCVHVCAKSGKKVLIQKLM